LVIAGFFLLFRHTTDVVNSVRPSRIIVDGSTTGCYCFISFIAHSTATWQRL